MVLNLHAVGGFSEVGKNMTVIDMGDDAVILDAGVHLPAIIKLQEQEEPGNRDKPSENRMRSFGALPDDLILDKLGIRKKIRAILIGHAHLDHVGAVPTIAYRYNAPVAGTPFTMSLLKRLMEDDKKTIPNKIYSIKPNSSFTIKGKKRNYEAEFINITHSTIQSTMLAIHTPEGVILYSGDYKFDNTPVVGLPPNYDALKRIAKEGVKLLVVNGLYSGSERKTPSEKIARAMLEEVLLTVNNEKSAIFVSTFSSHIARLKSIVDFSKKLNRNVYVLGRSMGKYISAANSAGMCSFRKDITIGTYKRQVESILKKVDRNKAQSLVICTGHQGEPGSILDRLARKKLPFHFKPNDNLVFSSSTIPVPVNIASKAQLYKRLKSTGMRLFDDIHVSGHCGREDIRDLLSIVNPEKIVPFHGSPNQLIPLVELAREMGYRTGKECQMLQDGQKLKL